MIIILFSFFKCFEVETDEKCPKYILNVISPKYDMNARDKFGSNLFITFINLFELANYLKLKQIGMPLLCTGNYGVNIKINFF